LAAGLSDFPQAFPNYFRATIAAGEQSGHLDVVLERLADYAENRQQLGSKFQLALLYPALISAVAILVVTFLLAYVVPQVVQVFENIGQQLPLLTRGLIALSAWVRSYGIALLIVIGIGVAAGLLDLRYDRLGLVFRRMIVHRDRRARFGESM